MRGAVVGGNFMPIGKYPNTVENNPALLNIDENGRRYTVQSRRR
jgi:hypothetical protein